MKLNVNFFAMTLSLVMVLVMGSCNLEGPPPCGCSGGGPGSGTGTGGQGGGLHQGAAIVTSKVYIAGGFNYVEVQEAGQAFAVRTPASLGVIVNFCFPLVQFLNCTYGYKTYQEYDDFGNAYSVEYPTLLSVTDCRYGRLASEDDLLDDSEVIEVVEFWKNPLSSDSLERVKKPALFTEYPQAVDSLPFLTRPALY